MTGPRRLPDPPPSVAGESVVRTSAGTPLTITLTLTNTAAAPRVLTVTAVGVDAEWLPRPVRTGPVLPGGSEAVELTIRPAVGAVPARYPMAVAVQALDPVTGEATSQPGLSELVIVLDAPGQVSVALDPIDATAVFGKNIDVVLRNAGATPAEVDLQAQTPSSTRITLHQPRLRVGPGETVRVRGRVGPQRARLIGGRTRHTYTVTAHSAGAPRQTEGSFTSRAVLGTGPSKVLALVAVVAVWVALAIIFIPKLANQFGAKQTVAQSTTSTAPGSGGGGGSGGSGGSGGGSGGSGSGSGSGGSGSGGGAGGAAAGAGQVALNGTIAGISPGDVGVNVVPTTFNDALGQGAQPVGVATATLRQIGKISSVALRAAAPTTAPTDVSVQSNSDGTWAVPPLPKRGYYLLTFAKAGFQTMRYVVDASSPASAKPLAVTMVPGQGSLAGTVAGPGGPVGAATVTITDGRTTTTTTTNSSGTIGAWSVQGLSTPASYLVTVSFDGLSTESQLVTLGPAGNATVNLTLQTGVVSLTGTITGTNDSGQIVGLGGATITAAGAGITRTVSTLTATGVAGSYILPDLPAGAYTVTISAPGYTSQTSGLTLVQGTSARTLSAQLTPATGVVAGVVTGTAVNGQDLGGQVGAGLVLTGPANTYKTTTTSDPAGGYTFDGVTPGTYTLTTSMFGFAPDTVTVTVTAGGTTTINRDLTSLIGGALPATATIKGSAQDARTLGPVNPPATGTASLGNACSSDGKADGAALTQFMLMAQVMVMPPTTKSNPNPTPIYYCTNFAPTDTYTLPDKTVNPDVQGIYPGLQTVTVSAPGYEAAQVKVTVPLAGSVTAPIASLYPAPQLVGQVISNKDLPAAATCIWAVPGPSAANQSVPSPTTPYGCTQLSATAPTSCEPPTGATMPDGTACTYLATPGAGAYTLILPAHGAYWVYATSANPDYETAGGFAVAPRLLGFGLGQVLPYNFFLNRFGHLTVLLQAPGPDGNLVGIPWNPATIGIGAAGPGVACPATTPALPAGDISAAPNGSVNVVGLNGQYAITATPTDGSQGGCTTQAVPLNTDASAALPLINPLAAFVGRMVYLVGGTPMPVAGATVTATGIYAYSGTQAVTRTWTMTTDADGCFAIHSTAAPSDSTTCTQINAEDPLVNPATTSAAVGYAPGISLLSNVVAISATRAGFSNFQIPTGPQTAAVNTYPMAALPVPFTSSGTTNTLLALPATVPAPTAAQISVLRTSDNTSGGITVSLTADTAVPVVPNAADLTWHDPALATAYGPNYVTPGTYTLTATLSGYQSATATLTCVVLPTAGCTLGSFVLKQLATITVSTVDSASAAVNGAVVTLYSGGTPVGSPLTAPSSSNSVTFTGITPDGTTQYSVGVQAAGYAFTTAAPTACGAPPGPGNAITCTVTLQRLGSITGTVTGVVQLASSIAATLAAHGTPVTSTIAAATVTAQHCTSTATGTDPIFGTTVTYCTAVDGPTFPATAPSSATGAFTITGSASNEGLEAGDYLVTVSGVGGWCQPATTAQGTCPATLPATVGSPAAPPLPGFVVTIAPAATQGADLTTVTVTPQLFQQPAVAVFNAFTQQGNKTTAATGLTMTIADPTGYRASPTTAVETLDSKGNGTGTYTFAQVLPGTYTVSASSSTYSLTYVTQAITLGGGPYPFAINKTNNEVKGTITAVQGAATVASGLPGAAVTVVYASSGCGSTPVTGNDGNPIQATTDANGQYDFTAVPNNGGSNKYQVCASLYGYVAGSSPSFTVSNNALSTQNLTLTRVTHNVTITLSAAVSGDVITGVSNATLTASATNGPANATLSNLSVSGSGSTVTISASGVPFGCWALSVKPPGGHYGTLSNPSGVSPSDTNPLGCASGELEVLGSGSASTAVTANYTLQEYLLTVNTNVTTIAPDTALPSAVTIAVNTTPAYSATLSSPTSGQQYQATLWVPTGSYTATASVPAGEAAGWSTANASKPVSVSTSGGTATLSLAEVGGTVVVTVPSATSTNPAQVSLTCTSTPTCPASNPTSQSVNSSTATATFAGLPVSATWQVSASLNGGSVTQTPTLTNGGTATLTMPSPTTSPLYLPAKITVTVANAATTSATVTLHCLSGTPSGTSCPADQTGTDTGSGVVFTNQLPGTYQVSATQGTSPVKSDSATVTVASGQVLPVPLSPH